MTEKIKILFAEDDRAMLDLYHKHVPNFFPEIDFMIVEAMDGIQALQKINNMKFDVIIMDLKMPKKGGLAVSKSIISSCEATPDKIIIVSGEIVQDDLVVFKELKINKVLHKPLVMDKLKEKIKQVIIETRKKSK